MDITYKFSNDKNDFWEMSLFALKHKLHVRKAHYMMKEEFEKIMREDMTPKALGIAFCGNNPVGAIIIHETGLIMTYVCKKYRHNGIGSTLVKNATQKANGNLFARPGILGSDKFYIKNGFSCGKPY